MPTESDDIELLLAPTESFHVRDAESANWVVRKIVEARKYRERVESWAAAEIRRAERQEALFLARFGQELEEWTRHEVAQLHKRKSLALPAGTVGFRRQPLRLAVSDEGGLIAWCKSHLPQAVKTVESVLKTAVMEHVSKTGECPNGAEVAGGGEAFVIK